MIQEKRQNNLSFDNTEIAFKGRSNTDLKRAYWLFKLLGSKLLVRIGSSVTQFALDIGLPITSLIRNTIYRYFCGGETITGWEAAIQHLAKQHVYTILDSSVEGEDSEA